MGCDRHPQWSRWVGGKRPNSDPTIPLNPIVALINPLLVPNVEIANQVENNQPISEMNLNNVMELGQNPSENQNDPKQTPISNNGNEEVPAAIIVNTINRPSRLNSANFIRDAMFIFSHPTNHSKKNCLVFIFYSFKILNHCHLGLDMRLNNRAGIVIAVGIWCLMTVVLANAYAGTLLSFLTVKKLNEPINSLDELANSKSCQLIVQGGTDFTNQFLVSHYLTSE